MDKSDPTEKVGSESKVLQYTFVIQKKISKKGLEVKSDPAYYWAVREKVETPKTRKRRLLYGHFPDLDPGTPNRWGRTPTRIVFLLMHSRCRKNSIDSKYYYDKGVRVCKRWCGPQGFRRFLEDMGPQPPGHQLDRFPDKHGNYKPGNVRWATRKENMRNTRNNFTVMWEGVPVTVRELSEKFGVNYNTIRERIKVLGWDVVRAVTTPARKMRMTY